ncbi:MAG: hypothetical protein KC713_02755 [Candidatus Omnitrophica bacterium]|nr:hypothetical protein [Candidatus Omnitrophota bacterium]
MDISIDDVKELYEEMLTKLDEHYVQALLLAEIINRILLKMAEIRLTSKPHFEYKPLSEFMKRMRVSSLGKFNEETYIAYLNLYKNQQDLENHKAVGTVVIYMQADFMTKLFKRLDYPDVDIDDEDALLDAIGTFCNLVGGNFKSGLTQLGYIPLEMSHFHSFKNEVLDGVEYCQTEKKVYEIDFEIKKEKQITAELVIGQVPRS